MHCCPQTAEWTPLSASLWPEILTEAGVPAGVVNVVHGTGPKAGQALVDVRGMDVPKADRPRRGLHRSCRAPPAPPGAGDPRIPPGPAGP
nr:MULTISPECIES: aldehyde dehydrogenase family protein [Streptomyces]